MKSLWIHKALLAVAIGIALSIVAYAIFSENAFLDMRLSWRHTVMSEQEDGSVALLFKPGVTLADVEHSIAAIDRVQKAPHVKSIFYFGSGQSDGARVAVQHFSEVAGIYFDGVPISEDLLQLILRLKRLHRLRLRNATIVDGAAQPAFAESTVKIIEIDASMFSDPMMRGAATAPQLKELTLYGAGADENALLRLKQFRPDVIVATVP